MPYTITRYHDISAGHRVAGHENKCANLHGHNYRIHFTCYATVLDNLGRLTDFSVLKDTLCAWLEEEWDHKFLMWTRDPFIVNGNLSPLLLPGLITVPFNPTAENMARYLVQSVGPVLLANTNVTLTRVKVEETYKCSAEYFKEGWQWQ